MIKIKETKSVEMWYEENDKAIFLDVKNSKKIGTYMVIPMSKIFQVQRGITSAIQRFYRYGKKNK